MQIYAFFIFFVQKSFLIKNCFLIAEINLTTQAPLYTCLVITFISRSPLSTLSCFVFNDFQMSEGCLYQKVTSKVMRLKLMGHKSAFGNFLALFLKIYFTILCLWELAVTVVSNKFR